MTNMRTDEQRLLDQVGRLPQAIAPGRDLWPDIESQLADPADEPHPAAAAEPAGSEVAHTGRWQTSVALAASLMLAVFVGYSLGREAVETPPDTSIAGYPVQAGTATQPVSLVEEVGLLEARRTMVADIEAGLERLPPDARTVVTENLRTINQALDEIDAVLAGNPAGGLDRQLLVAMYADQLTRLSSMQTLVMNSNQEILL